MTAAITARTELDTTYQGHRFIASGEIMRHPKCPDSTRNAPNPLAIRASGRVIIPDALYGIDYGGKYRFFALEADRGTEPLTGRGRASRYIQDKIEAYSAILRTETYRHVWGIPVLTVRIVCESAARTEHIRTLIGRVASNSDIARKFQVESLR
jgi:hypothetical protein